MSQRDAIRAVLVRAARDDYDRAPSGERETSEILLHAENYAFAKLREAVPRSPYSVRVALVCEALEAMSGNKGAWL
jgi:hypothetical protein